MPIISFQEAQNLNYALAIPDLETTEKSIYEAFGEILAIDLVCNRPLPAFDNSAMDGYALKSSDLGKKIRVVSTILAGEDIKNLEVLEGTCVKIMTGGMMPKGADLVIPFEDVEEIDGEFVTFGNSFKVGANVRFKGEEKSLGSLIAKKGDKLTHGLIALIASQGISKVSVYRKLKIGIYSTGDEIIEPGQNASDHQIYNINAAGIMALLSSYGHQAQYLGIFKDSLREHLEAIKTFVDYDVIITSGGASVGEADLLERSLCECGAKVVYHGINLKPGRPIMLATLGKCAIFALPGNPLSGILNLNMIVIPALEHLRKANAFYPQPFYAQLKNPLKLKSGRVNMVLGRYDNGEFIAHNGGKYGSGAIDVISSSNCVALMGEGVSLIQGDIRILPYVMEFSDTINCIINE